MTNEYVTGIDIGTHAIKIVVTESSQNNRPHILHAISSLSHGFRHGYMSDFEMAQKSLALAIKKVEKITKQKIEEAYFSISGMGLSSRYVKTEISVNEITERDIHELIEKAERLFTQKYPNKKILHIIPIKFLVDGREVLGSPVGMYGQTLSAKIIFITILEHHYDAFLSLIKTTSIDIRDIIASPLADAEASLSYNQKAQGCILANIGSETTSLSTFENGVITSLKISQIGSNDITNDLALGLQTSLETADEVKLKKNKDFPKRKIDDIIQARIADILEIGMKHLKALKKNRLLPAGIIFSGGGSKIEFIEAYARKMIHLPAERVNIYKYSKKTKRNTNIGPEFSVAYGLCFTGRRNSYHRTTKFNWKKVKRFFSNMIEQIMP